MSDLSSGGTQQFEFRGKAGEWFGIWIVNLLLSIITIGIYSAWAKVRTKKYFYNHTFVQDRNFDYHATGGQILIGRLIFIGGYVAFSLIISLVPFLGIILVLGLLVLIPWLIVKSMQFNARVSSFSNVRFNFVGKTGRAFVVFILMPIVAYIVIAALLGGGGALAFTSGSVALGAILGIAGIVVMFFAFPIVDKAVKQYVVNNYRLGNAEFLLDVSLKPFVKAFGFAFGWVLVVGLLSALLLGNSVVGAFEALEALDNGGDPDPAALGVLGLLYLLFFVALLPAGFIYQAMIRNTMYNNTTLTGGHQFRSTVGPAKLLWIALSNAIVVAFTLGLMLPWAHVRMHKYLATQTFLIPGGSLDDFVGKQVEDGMSVADAYTDLEGVDFGMPL
ncbi:YjgN family protein [uncultured Litoreibacter sp.]|uniref:YjgN family protein n=1 Tax=uncultured Litoreibacter sp. TaxID=1392394 RepID=UPI00260446DF|nr:YjgN family protein [uncultured Litoreibacter sp.]